MPTISRFYGIVIAMFFNDHPPPHFHVRYAEHKGRVDIATGALLDGELPARARRMVEEWCGLHREQLFANWERGRAGEPLLPVEPLP